MATACACWGPYPGQPGACISRPFLEILSWAKKVVQKVWESVHRYYISEEWLKSEAAVTGFELKNLLRERSLNNSLRGILLDITTGTYDVAASGPHQRGATPQDPDILNQLKRLDTYARRKMSYFRDSLIYPQCMA